MKRKHKFFLLVILLLVLFFPFKIKINEGVFYLKSISYEISKSEAFSLTVANGYIEQEVFEIKVFGFSLYEKIKPLNIEK